MRIKYSGESCWRVVSAECEQCVTRAIRLQAMNEVVGNDPPVTCLIIRFRFKYAS